MTREELLRILDFVDQTRRLSEQSASLTSVDPRWNIISYVMRRHLEGKLITITSAAMSAEVPYGTALRRVNELIDTDFLMRRSRSKSGKSFSLHPTRKLIAEFESFAMQFKSMIGNAFGFSSEEKPIDEFYFGAYYMASRILSYPSAMRNGIGPDKHIRILCPLDPTFRVLDENVRTLSDLCGTTLEFVQMPIDALHSEIIENHSRSVSAFTLIAVDLPWMGELADAKMIIPLDEMIAQAAYNSSDFHPAAWKGSAWNGRQFALPIQPTAELLLCRSDLLAEAGLTIPKTTDEVLEAARTLHCSKRGLSGIILNCGRGTPAAHTFMMTLADFGRPILDLPAVGDEFGIDRIEGEQFRPMIDTTEGRQASEYLLEIFRHAHAESIRCEWDRQFAVFSSGEAAMCYGWSVRAAAFERDEASPAHSKVAFVPHPPAPGCRAVSPIGGFSLGIPSGLEPANVSIAWKVMEYLTRPELLKWYVQKGSLTSPRFSTSADPEVQSSSAMIGAIDAMERRGTIQIWPRPPVPEFTEILSVLGSDIHEMLRGEVSVGQALSAAQNRIDTIMRANGRY